MYSTDSTSSDSEIDALVKFKTIKGPRCVVCKTTGASLRATEKSFFTFLKSTKIRDDISKSTDVEIHKAISEGKSGNWGGIHWHKNCYISYTSKKNMEVLRNRSERSQEYREAGIEPPQPPHRTLRKDVYDISKCVFCQKRSAQKRLSQVMSKNIENKIKYIASMSSEVLQRIGLNDLIAMEVKYHPNCLIIQKRKFSKQDKRAVKEGEGATDINSEDKPLQKIVTIVEGGIGKGKGFTATSIYNRYKEFGGTKSKRTLMENLKKHFGSEIDIAKSNKANVSSVVLPSITKSDTIHNYIESTSSSHDSSLFSGFSELSQIHKICTDIKVEMDSIPDFMDSSNLNISDYKIHIPQALLWIISLLITDEGDVESTNLLSICQDIIYARFKGKKWTPKHIGIGILVHQETRSKKLVESLHSCGHSVSYKDVLRLRNSIAQEEIARYLHNDNCYIPQQLIPDKFVHFAADNIDILEETLDKSPTFHGTQIVAFQEGPPNMEQKKAWKLLPYHVKLEIPENFDSLHKVIQSPNKILPKVSSKSLILEQNEQDSFMFAYNLSWILCRTVDDEFNQEAIVVPQWSGFGKLLHEDKVCTTTYGYLPLLPYVASEYDTVYTTMKRCSEIARKLGNEHTVITFDQAIYYKAKQIQWLNPEEFANFVIRLGGFHIMLNFLKVIGQHMSESGLSDVWLESGLYGDSTIAGILSGKKWNKGIRAHKITYESLMRILVPRFERWLTECNSDMIHTLNLSRLMAKEICKSIKQKESPTNFFHLVRNSDLLRDIFKEFLEDQSPNFNLWCRYMELVEILLAFVYSERVGNWTLHLQSFSSMLPWFFAYDHMNYSRWGCIYLGDMLELPNAAPAVHKKFVAGNFVVKRLSGGFNKISVDQALEHVNKISKDAGGIIGLTKNSTRLHEWYLSFNEIGKMANNFVACLKLSNDNSSQNIEMGKKRILVDKETVLSLVDQFNKFEVFTYTGSNLISISTKEIYPKEVEKLRLSAKERGADGLKRFIDVMDTPEFYKPLKKLNTCVKVKPKSEIYSAKSQTLQGQQLLQRILAAKQLGRTVDYNEVFQLELTPLPMSLTVSGCLGTPSNKSALSSIIASYVTCHQALPNTTDTPNLKVCHIFDGMSVVQALGKPSKCRSFGEYASLFSNIIFKNKYNAQRIDVVFDHYKDNSIKSATRQKRGSQTSIHRMIETPDAPLPQQWNLFIHSVFNKKQLTNFLSKQLIEQASRNANIQFATSGGFTNILEYSTTFEMNDSDLLQSSHEEADTRILLHVLSAKKFGYFRCIIDCNDTDVLVLLLHFKQYLTPEIWMKIGRGDSSRYIPVHEIQLQENLVRNLPAFHALTGCDTTSQFTGIGKKSCWKTYLEHCEYLEGVGVANFSSQMFHRIETFVIKLYSTSANVTSINVLRGLLAASATIAKLPPTEDSLRLHSLRAYYQAKVWYHSLEPRPQLPNVEDFGWKIDDGKISPVLTTLPAFPQHLNVLASCGCKTDCRNKLCTCRRNRMGCIGSCKCMAQQSCQNKLTLKTNQPLTEHEDISDADE